MRCCYIQDSSTVGDHCLFLMATEAKMLIILGYSMGDILNNDEGFVCMFIVDNTYQRRGIGKTLFTKCMEVLADKNVTLFATEKGAPYYKKHFGFKPIEEKARVVLLDIFQPNKMAFEGNDIYRPHT